MNDNDECRIPDDITPNEYFLEYLPKFFEKNKKSIDAEYAKKTVITYELTGKGGGAWTLSLENGALKTSRGDSPERVVKILQKLNDWQCGLFGKQGFNVFSDASGVLEISPTRFFSASNVDKLKTINGAIKLKLNAPGQSEWNIILIFGTEERPSTVCTITIDAPDVEGLRNRKTDPQEAFMAGKIKIHGDVALAMRVGALFTKRCD